MNYYDGDGTYCGCLQCGGDEIYVEDSDGYLRVQYPGEEQEWTTTAMTMTSIAAA